MSEQEELNHHWNESERWAKIANDETVGWARAKQMILYHARQFVDILARRRYNPVGKW